MSVDLPESREFLFLLVPGFSLLALSGAIDVLRAANLESSKTVYRWRLLGETSSVESSSGLAMDCHPLPQISARQARSSHKVLVVCGGDTSRVDDSSALTHWLKSLPEKDMLIGSISDAAFVVAQSGLFDQHRSTIHWKCLDTYRLQFPHLDTRATILEMDGNRFSCAGGSASLDLFLQFVLQDLGTEVVARIADNYFHDTLRDSSISQNVSEAYRYAGKSRVLAEALRIMAQHLEQPLSVAEIARQSGTTHRSLDRLFGRYLSLSPGKYYRRLRLNRAANLLLQTGLPVSEIAVASGFGTASHLGLHFKEAFDLSPGQFRLQGFKAARKVESI